jgi:thymidylate synthase
MTYEDLLTKVLGQGVWQHNRTGIDTKSLFGAQLRFNLRRNTLPLITTKKVFFRGVVEELLWFLRGDTNVRSLQEKDIHIWDEWANENGDLGRVYGAQWRDWRGPDGSSTDQIRMICHQIRYAPESRRIIVSAWNPGELEQMALPPCHMFFQFYVNQKANELSCQMYQRSADLFLGVPFNIASYALLTHIVARACGLQAVEFIHTFGDVHLYENHLDAVVTQLEREPRPFPKIKLLGDFEDLSALSYDQFILEDYNPWPGIKAEVAV